MMFFVWGIEKYFRLSWEKKHGRQKGYFLNQRGLDRTQAFNLWEAQNFWKWNGLSKNVFLDHLNPHRHEDIERIFIFQVFHDRGNGPIVHVDLKGLSLDLLNHI